MKTNAYLAYLKMTTSARQIMAQNIPEKTFLIDQSAPATTAGRKGKVLIFSPHPDDEALIGGLALRFLRSGYRVVNVAVTLGSKLERRAGRLAELRDSCDCLGFQLAIIGTDGLDNVNLKSRRAGSAGLWQAPKAH